MKIEKIENGLYQVWFNDFKAVVVKAKNEKDAERKAKAKKF